MNLAVLRGCGALAINIAFLRLLDQNKITHKNWAHYDCSQGINMRCWSIDFKQGDFDKFITEEEKKEKAPVSKTEVQSQIEFLRRQMQDLEETEKKKIDPEKKKSRKVVSDEEVNNGDEDGSDSDEEEIFIPVITEVWLTFPFLKLRPAIRFALSYTAILHAIALSFDVAGRTKAVEGFVTLWERGHARLMKACTKDEEVRRAYDFFMHPTNGAVRVGTALTRCMRYRKGTSAMLAGAPQIVANWNDFVQGDFAVEQSG